MECQDPTVQGLNRERNVPQYVQMCERVSTHVELTFETIVIIPTLLRCLAKIALKLRTSFRT